MRDSDSQPVKIRIGVSSCLLGNKVRYDGRDKLHQKVMMLCNQFDCIAICPEVAIGLGVPRPPVNLVQVGQNMRVRSTDNPEHDMTEDLINYADTVCKTMPDLCGYIFKARSPSCGIQSSPYLNQSGEQLGKTSGVFSKHLLQAWMNLPVIEETQLENEMELKCFLAAVEKYANR